MADYIGHIESILAVLKEEQDEQQQADILLPGRPRDAGAIAWPAGVRTLLSLLFDTADQRTVIRRAAEFHSGEQLSLGLASADHRAGAGAARAAVVSSSGRTHPAAGAEQSRRDQLGHAPCFPQHDTGSSPFDVRRPLFAAQDFLKWLLAGVPQVEYGAGGAGNPDRNSGDLVLTTGG